MEWYGAKCKINYKGFSANISSDMSFTPRQYIAIGVAPLLAAIMPIVLLKLSIFPLFSAGWLAVVIAGCGGDFLGVTYSLKYFFKDVAIYDKGTVFTIVENKHKRSLGL